MGIDPVTHKPFSEILTDYGKIGGLPKAGNQMGSLNRDLRNAFISKPEASSVDGISMTTMRTPMMEPIEDGWSDSNNNRNYSWDLLRQLQAIKLVQEATQCSKQEIIEPIFYSEGSSSSSSSFSTTIQVSSPSPFPCQQSPPLQTAQSPPFSWGEFLLEDVSLPSDLQQQCFQGSSSLTQVHDEMQQSQLNNFGDVGGDMDYGALNNMGQSIPGTVGDEATNIFRDSLSSDNSFLKAILDHDNQMSWEFPDILGEPFY
ncbi:hypothetical protein NE237_007235 [Protea cynaroides]|uniref:Uncharacterized protein n=1 Tax=Protea cynaroides TaxID=273540 RepID=A0A9Q0KPU1_9MAGN|nr:hypothetical protein NE237_007235 [Protea cynaroides]